MPGPEAGSTVKNFPLMIVAPVSAKHLSGKLVLSHAAARWWLTNKAGFCD
jgi:hypothetical protein